MSHAHTYKFNGGAFCCTQCPAKLDVTDVEDGLNEISMLAYAKKIKTPDEIFNVLQVAMQYLLKKHNKIAFPK